MCEGSAYWFRLGLPKGSSGDWVIKKIREDKLLDPLLSSSEFEIFEGKEFTYLNMLLPVKDVKALFDSLTEYLPKSAKAGIDSMWKEQSRLTGVKE